jgi:putative transposase
MDEMAGLSEGSRKLALDRFRLLQPQLEQSRPLRLLAAEAGIAFRTPQRWVAQYQRFGLAALARRKRDDSDARRAVAVKVKGGHRRSCFTEAPLPVAALYRQVRRWPKTLGSRLQAIQ